ncbi:MULTISPECIES: DUF998 domain-containing protein [unclassified Salipiger]|uniref:DUF998 domain-containing protein n=1 Tax=unclassified Salipiger TaxID=2640570 RepID=UPI0013B79947|nr:MULTISPECIES: DUF998 domain-containing protein [unclassified Salipiger]NDV49733.1 DUF998 domain-containing protein [Salipiger sp. PrR003]NDW33507.1 DUF998 domain-containing protein [Salipiger sp. PrR007]
MPLTAETPRQLPAETAERPALMHALVLLAIFGCVALTASILIADFVVPDHDWIADTISDLGAGRYEFIVDTGLYAFSAALIGLAVLAAHVHLGAWDWSVGIIALIVFGLLVFLIGARNEYGDNDSEGWVIHTYLVYALGLAMATACFALARGAARVGPRYRTILIGTGVVWCASAPIFFFLPTAVDGIYERYLGAVSYVLVLTLAHLFHQRAKQRKAT